MRGPTALTPAAAFEIADCDLKPEPDRGVRSL
jgi:hypothetical protein